MSKCDINLVKQMSLEFEKTKTRHFLSCYVFKHAYAFKNRIFRVQSYSFRALKLLSVTNILETVSRASDIGCKKDQFKRIFI